MGVLDDMTKGITERKAKAAGPKLTPVGAEASPTKPSQRGIPDVPEVFLTNEAVADIARDLRKQAATLVQVADALDAHTGEQGSAPFEVKPGKVEQRLVGADPEVDPGNFAKDFAAKAKAAQAATFTAADAPEPTKDSPAITPASGWTCPDHPSGTLMQLTSRSGRHYLSCVEQGCQKFERK